MVVPIYPLWARPIYPGATAVGGYRMSEVLLIFRLLAISILVVGLELLRFAETDALLVLLGLPFVFRRD